MYIVYIYTLENVVIVLIVLLMHSIILGFLALELSKVIRKKQYNCNTSLVSPIINISIPCIVYSVYPAIVVISTWNCEFSSGFANIGKQTTLLSYPSVITISVH